MKIEFANDKVTLVLSRRNLLTLLAKLDGYPPNSACTIMGGSDAPGVLVRAEEDDVHYQDRPAGRMHPETETHTTKPTTGTKWSGLSWLLLLLPRRGD